MQDSGDKPSQKLGAAKSHPNPPNSARQSARPLHSQSSHGFEEFKQSDLRALEDPFPKQKANVVDGDGSTKQASKQSSGFFGIFKRS